jgi:UDP-N-acetylglucosamine 3-dehydrogenase
MRPKEHDMDELGIGLIGVGRMGAYHVETWERIAAGRLVAVADPDESTARARIGRRPIEWVVCAPSEHHARIALEAIAAGKHVFVEKPIATALEDGLRMAAAARLARVKLMVGHVERFNPAVGKLAELIREGRIGRVFRAHATRVGPLPVRIQDTGVAIDLATHDLDLRRRLPLRAPLPGGPDRLPAALRRRRAARPARRQLADAREAP